MAVTLGTIFLLISPLIHARMGGAIFHLFRLIFKADSAGAGVTSTSLIWCFILLGLQIHLVGSFVLLCLGLPWTVAVLAPMAISFLPASINSLKFPFRIWRRGISFAQAFWLAVVFLLGLSLFDVVDGIQTPWKNNYGDLAYHLGMIHSFSFSSEYPPQNHLFAGERLIYPFFINLWSALFWWQSGSYPLLKIIFVFQWCLLWAAAFHFVRGRRYILLPWVLLLGGGSYFALGSNSGEVISTGYPWSSFFTTIWVTQRAALFGAVVALGALSIFLTELRTQKPRLPLLALASTMLALSPLIHTHIFVVVTLFCGLLLAIQLFQGRFKLIKFKDKTSILMAFVLPLVASLFFLPLLVGKSHIFSLSSGWLPGSEPTLAGTAMMWLLNAPLLFILAALFFVLARQWVALFVLSALFAVAHLVQLSFWDWDQIKIFLALYLIFIAIWASTRSRRLWFIHLLTLFLCLPSLYEVVQVAIGGKQFTVYSQAELSRAKQLRSSLSSDAVLLSAPLHNSAATISGRALYYGYEGTLSSHGLDYLKRRESIFNFLNGDITLDQMLAPVPSAVIWSDQERIFYRRQTVPAGLRQDSTFEYLYYPAP